MHLHSIAAGAPAAKPRFAVQGAARHFENARLMGGIYHALFQITGTCSAPRFAGQVLAGLEMALWDIAGKTVGRPVHDLLGGAVRDEIGYFGFPQGATAEETAAEAKTFTEAGCDVIHVKVGRGDKLDLAVVEQVRGRDRAASTASRRPQRALGPGAGRADDR